MTEEYDNGFPWLSDDEYAKALGQFRMAVGAHLRVFDCYGLGQFITPVTQAICDLAEDFGMRVRGEDRPIDTKHTPRERPTD